MNECLQVSGLARRFRLTNAHHCVTRAVPVESASRKGPADGFEETGIFHAAVLRFKSASFMLDMFGMANGGKEYRRLVAAFERIFGATMFFGTDPATTAKVVHRARFNFLSEATIWYQRESGGENVVTLSQESFSEVIAHPIPADLAAVKVLVASPGALDLFSWLPYRCFTAKGRGLIPLFGPMGLAHQREATIWYQRDAGRENVVTLTEEFFAEVMAHPIPADLEEGLHWARRALDRDPLREASFHHGLNALVAIGRRDVIDRWYAIYKGRFPKSQRLVTSGFWFIIKVRSVAYSRLRRRWGRHVQPE